MIKQNLDTLLAHVRSLCVAAGRDPGTVTVVGVTKYSDVAAINEAVAAGLVHIAENRVQSAKEKFPLLMPLYRGHIAEAPKGIAMCPRIATHLIGHLQTNKAKDAVELFDLIQSVDSIKLAAEIDKRAAALGKVQDILLQLDIAREEQKFGLAEEEINSFLEHVKGCAHIRLRGLMAMAPLTKDQAVVRSVFRRLREHFERISKEHAVSGHIMMEHLSMGMSGDYAIAIEEGATMVRIGSAIFK